MSQQSLAPASRQEVEQLAQELEHRLNSREEKQQEQFGKGATEPRYNHWASMIDSPCLRQLWYNRQEPWAAEPFPLRGLKRMNEGNNQEKITRAELAEVGCELKHIQRRAYIDQVKVSGKIDGILVPSWIQLTVLGEIKSMVDNQWEQMKTVEDLDASKWYRKYVDQCHCYMKSEGVEVCLLILRNIVSGDYRILPVWFDVERWIEIEDKLDLVNTFIEAEEIPDRIGNNMGDPDICGDCRYRAHCLPDILNEGGVIFIDEEEAVANLNRMEELKPLKAEYDRLDKWKKERFKNINNVSIGPFLITGQEVERKGYVVDDGSYWKVKVQRITEE